MHYPCLPFSVCSLSSLLTPFAAEVLLSSLFLATSSAQVFSLSLTSRGPSLISRSLTILLKDLTSLASANLLLDDAYNVKTKSLNIDNTEKKKTLFTSSEIVWEDKWKLLIKVYNFLIHQGMV